MTPHAKQRRREKRERKLLEYNAALSALQATGASCATCKHYGTLSMVKGRICEMQSDFHGYVQIEPTDLCLDYGRRAKP